MNPNLAKPHQASGTMLRKLLRTTPLAWLQVKRERMRLLVAVAGIAFADVLMFVQLGLKAALYDSAASPYVPLQGDLFMINPLFQSLILNRSFDRKHLIRAAGVDGVASTSHLYVGPGSWRNPDTRLNYNILMFGVDPTNPAFRMPGIGEKAGQLKQLNRVLYDRAGRDVFGDVPALLGRTNPLSIQVNERQLQVTGLFTMGASFAADSNLITSDSTFLRLFPQRSRSQIDVGLITMERGASLKDVQARLQAHVSDDVIILTQEEFIDREKAYWAETSPIGFIFGFGTVIGFIVGIVIVYQILYSDVSDHLSEYATLKAMGYTNSYLVGVLIQQSFILAALGFAPGLILSIGLYSITQAATLLSIGMTLERAATVLGLTVVMCTASGAVAMRKLQSADPADIF
jgi:putative ABC transport system permease protein